MLGTLKARSHQGCIAVRRADRARHVLVIKCTITRVSSSSGSSGVVQAVCTLPLHSVVLINRGEFPLDEVTDSFWKKNME